MTPGAHRSLQWCCGLAAALVLAASCGQSSGSAGSSGAGGGAQAPAGTVSTSTAPVPQPVAPTTTRAATDPATTTPTSSTNAPPLTTSPPAVRSGSNVNDVGSLGDPLGLTIESIGIDTPVVSTGVLADGTVAVPIDPNIAGWYTGGPRPGELGPAVIMGHVDSKKSGPGVFWRLRDLAVGADVVVHAERGDVHFVVTAREQVPKDAFPTQQVYGAVPERALRLITCGGSFDRSIGHYRDNVVVYLVAVSP